MFTQYSVIIKITALRILEIWAQIQATLLTGSKSLNILVTLSQLSTYLYNEEYKSYISGHYCDH